MADINKDEFLKMCCEECELDMSRVVMRAAYDSICRVLRQCIIDRKDVALHGIGTFHTAVKEAHTAYSPIDRSEVEVPDRLIGKFKINTNLKLALREIDVTPARASGGRRS